MLDEGLNHVGAFEICRALEGAEADVAVRQPHQHRRPGGRRLVAARQRLAGLDQGEGAAGRDALGLQHGGGQDFADALVAGPLGYAARFPILITPTARLSAQTRTTLQGLGIKRVIVPGGTSAVSTSVENEIKALGITVQRFGGQVRSETATLVAAYAYDSLDFDRSHVDLARGDQFPDTLTGGPHAGVEHAPILLTATPNSLGTATEAFLRNRGVALRDGHVFGGTAAVSTATEEAAERAAATR